MIADQPQEQHRHRDGHAPPRMAWRTGILKWATAKSRAERGSRRPAVPRPSCIGTVLARNRCRRLGRSSTHITLRPSHDGHSYTGDGRHPATQGGRSPARYPHCPRATTRSTPQTYSWSPAVGSRSVAGFRIPLPRPVSPSRFTPEASPRRPMHGSPTMSELRVTVDLPVLGTSDGA
jgi:hypothetical protein